MSTVEILTPKHESPLLSVVTVLTVWFFLFFLRGIDFALELFRQCVIFVFFTSIDFALELFRQCVIFVFFTSIDFALELF
jgi:hypothetical protein